METIAPGNYVVAVSGGVDSVVLLDMVARRPGLNLIIAHFDHGTRDDSADDARFVGTLAKRYGIVYETKREELGPGVSEETARQRRYEFLHKVAKKYQAGIITAHHADDVIETITINLHRGTGWRGLAVLDSPNVVRPLIRMQKSDLVNYATEHQLTWHEDSTNASDTYLRNRLRKKLIDADEDMRRQLLALRDHQQANKRSIDAEAALLVGQLSYSRYFFIMINEKAALELLRTIIVKKSGSSSLTGQLQRALLAIKVAPAGTQHDVGSGVRLEFTRTEFVVNVS